MCRLPSPRAFLQSIPQFLKPGGLLVLVSPYSWLEEYTPVSEWVGAVPSANTSTSAGGVDSFSCLQAYLEQSLPVGMRLQLISKVDIPFLIREHERKFQYGVSDATIWKLPIQ